MNMALESFRPWLLGIALLLLGISALQLYRGGRRCSRRSPASLLLLGVSATIVLGMMLFPQAIAEPISTIG